MLIHKDEEESRHNKPRNLFAKTFKMEKELFNTLVIFEAIKSTDKIQYSEDTFFSYSTCFDWYEQGKLISAIVN